MRSLLKKFLASLLIALTVFISVAPYFGVVVAQQEIGQNTQNNDSPQNPPAQTTWYNQSFQEWYGKVYDNQNPNEIFGERYTAAQVQWIVYGLFGFLINSATGSENTGIINCLIAGLGTGQVDPTCIASTASIPGPAISTNSDANLISLVFADRPISGVSYVKERIKNFSLVPIAKAQANTAGVGFGFTALEPIQGMWRAFRDIAYGLFVIVAVVFAFMIMFRVKLSPQTVISVQSALPKIITSLIFVTFSYAIAGFLIDFAYIVIGLISVIGSGIITNALRESITPVNIFNFLTLGQPWGGTTQLGILGLMGVYVFVFAASLISILVSIMGLVGLGIGSLLSVVIVFLGILIVLWNGLKTVFALIKAFANVLLLTIVAPIQITLGSVVPNLGFGSWLKSYLAALSTFVVTGALLLFSFIFLFQGGGIAWSASSGEIIRNIIIGTGTGQNIASWPPLLGSSVGGIGLVFLVVSFVLFTMIPKATEIVQGFITGKPFAYGTAIGEAFGPARWAWGQTGAPVLSAVQKATAEEIIKTRSREIEKLVSKIFPARGTNNDATTKK